MFLDTIQDKYLFQHVENPTRHVLNSAPHVLDLIITNEEEMVGSIDVLPALGLSDHVCLQFNFRCYCFPNHPPKPRYNIKQANFDKMRHLLALIEWQDFLTPLNIHSAWSEFTLRFTNIINECIPFDIPRHKKSIFMTHAALRLKNMKCKLWNKYQRTKSPSDYQLYCQSRNKLRNLTRLLRRKYETKLASNKTSNIKQFWKYINSRLKTRPSINSVKYDDNSITDSDQEKCELFNKFFTSVFTKEDCTSIPMYQWDGCHLPLTDITITSAVVLDKLSHLNPTKAPGPEGWPIICLKESAQELCTPLSILFTKSLASSALPKCWKEAMITPVYKKGDRSYVGNYRPISLTSPLCKIMESIIKDNIQEHLIVNNVISPLQHGFTPGRSCSTQLLLAMNYWTKALNNGHCVDILYFDFAKAFDSVPHNRLISKLQGCGISGKLLAWVKSFLTGRKQKVVLNNQESKWSNVTSGVPQGSVLGPILFNIYVSDMPLIVNSTIFQFADDVKMFRTIKTIDDYLQLQHDIDILFAWSEKWQLKFNISKCNLLHLGHPHGLGDYTIDGTVITPCNVVRDLGILIDAHLKFHDHTTSVSKKANRILALIRRSFQYFDNKTFINLYKSFVRPILEYGNVIWGPHYILDQDQIEKVQRRATKLIHDLQNYTYNERLTALNLPSLKYRRTRGDMIMVYQLIHNYFNIDISDLFTTAALSTTRGHNFKLFKPQVTSRVRSSFFTSRTITHWNSLPDHVVNAPTLNQFKNLLDSSWSTSLYD